MQNKETEYLIPTVNIARFNQEMAILAKRANKLGFNTIEYTDHGYAEKKVKGKIIPCRRITVIGEPPVINGWHFVAKLEHISEETNSTLILRAGQNSVDLQQFKDCQPNCEHCKVNRNRKSTFVLYNPNANALKQVGSSCLGDFLKTDSPQKAAAYAELLLEVDNLLGVVDDELDSDEENASRNTGYLALDEVLAHTLSHLSSNGYISRASAAEQRLVPTATYIEKSIYTTPISALNFNQEELDTILAWLKSDALQERTSGSEFFYNIQTLAEAKWVPVNRLGLAVAIVPAYQNFIKQHEKIANAPKSEYLGTPGEKLTQLKVKLNGTHSFNTNWGLNTLYFFEDEQGNKISWNNSGQGLSARKGESFHITGTVKQHKLYRDQEQTVLQRVTAHEDKLVQAILDNKTNDALKLLKQPTNIDYRFNLGYDDNLSFLMLASQKSNPQIVEALLKAGADTRLQNNHGHAGFYAVLFSEGDYTSQQKSIECLDLLLKADCLLLDVPNKSNENLLAILDYQSLLKNGLDAELAKQYQGLLNDYGYLETEPALTADDEDDDDADYSPGF